MLLMALFAGAVVAIAFLIGSQLQTRPAVDSVERSERWMIQHAPRPLQRILRYSERQTVGGVLTALAFVLVFGTAAVLGFLLDAIDEQRGIANWDESAAEWGAANVHDASRDVLVGITQLGGSIWLLLVMGTIGFVAWVSQRRAGTSAYLAVVGIGVVLVNNALKLLVDRERPDIAQLAGHSGSSFPSGHSAAAAACWAAILLVATRPRRRRIRAAGAVAAVVIAVAVAATRVLLGVHWMTDVIAGVAVGWAWFALVTVIFGGRLLRFGRPADIARVDAGVPPETGAPTSTDTDQTIAQLERP